MLEKCCPYVSFKVAYHLHAFVLQLPISWYTEVCVCLLQSMTSLIMMFNNCCLRLVMECDTTFSGIVYTMYSSSVYNIKLKYSTLPPSPSPKQVNNLLYRSCTGWPQKITVGIVNYCINCLLL